MYSVVNYDYEAIFGILLLLIFLFWSVGYYKYYVVDYYNIL